MSLFRRLEPFLYSRRNIVGSALGLFGVGMLLVGLTGGLIGVASVAALYGIGYLITPAERGVSLTLFGTDDTKQIRRGLEKLLESIRFRVADDVFQAVGSIAHSIVMTFPQDGAGIDPTDPNVNLVRQTALSYLPEALNAYLAIPRIYAERRPVQGGQTAHDILMGQLRVMDARMGDVAEAIAKNDTDRLLSQVRFLQERFANSALEVAGAKPTVTDTSDGPRVV
jgi:hypothetical protein